MYLVIHSCVWSDTKQGKDYNLEGKCDCSLLECLFSQVTGSFQSIQDALIHITGRIRDVIIPKPHPSGGMPPYPPAGNIPLHQPRQEPPPPHPHHSGGMPPYPMHSFRADAPMGPFETGGHRPPLAHSMEHMGADRMPYSYGCEQGGPRPFLEQPSPRTWAPEVSNLEGLLSQFVKFVLGS